LKLSCINPAKSDTLPSTSLTCSPFSIWYLNNSNNFSPMTLISSSLSKSYLLSLYFVNSVNRTAGHFNLQVQNISTKWTFRNKVLPCRRSYIDLRYQNANNILQLRFCHRLNARAEYGVETNVQQIDRDCSHCIGSICYERQYLTVDLLVLYLYWTIRAKNPYATTRGSASSSHCGFTPRVFSALNAQARIL